jgi:hypothetical protein
MYNTLSFAAFPPKLLIGFHKTTEVLLINPDAKFSFDVCKYPEIEKASAVPVITAFDIIVGKIDDDMKLLYLTAKSPGPVKGEVPP